VAISPSFPCFASSGNGTDTSDDSLVRDASKIQVPLPGDPELERPIEFALKTTKVTATHVHPVLKLDWQVENSKDELQTDNVVVLIFSGTNTTNEPLQFTSVEITLDYHDQGDCLLLIPTLHIADKKDFDPNSTSTRVRPVNIFRVEGPGVDKSFVHCTPDTSTPHWVEYVIAVQHQPHSDGRGDFLEVPANSSIKLFVKAKLGKPGDYKIYVQEEWPKVADNQGTSSLNTPVQVQVLPRPTR
jgi:hypothetical protein